VFLICGGVLLLIGGLTFFVHISMGAHLIVFSIVMTALVIACVILGKRFDLGLQGEEGKKERRKNWIGIIIAFGLKGAAKQQETTVERLEIPLPLKNTSEQILYRKGYTVSYNKGNKIPNWVAWHLTAEHATGPYRRPSGAWHEDNEVPAPRATFADYRDCGWSRGHMCPAGDNKWDKDAMYDSFLLTNCCPQDANLNSGDWNQIEMSCRRWAQKYGDVYIVCGPVLYRKEHETIGPNKIVVPEAFYKVVLCLNGKPKGIGFIRKNTDTSRRNDLYVNTISEVERITGMTFFPTLSKEVAATVKSQANLKDWN
jgi:endonuclease G